MKLAMPVALAAVLFAGTATAGQLTSDQAADRAAIVATIDAVGFYADRDEWDRVADQFNPDGVVLDYRSYATASAGTGEAPAPQSPESVVAAWQTVLPGYDYTQHVIANHQVALDGDRATARSNVHATHVLGNEHWVFLGDYEHHLVRTASGWKIDRMTANLRAELGNPDLPARAGGRVAAGEGRLASR